MGTFLDESDQVTYILDGLLEEYDPMVMNMAATNLNDAVSVAYVHGLLLNMKTHLSYHRASSMPLDQTTIALFTPKNGSNTNFGRGSGCQSRGRGVVNKVVEDHHCYIPVSNHPGLG